MYSLGHMPVFIKQFELNQNILKSFFEWLLHIHIVYKGVWQHAWWDTTPYVNIHKYIITIYAQELAPYRLLFKPNTESEKIQSTFRFKLRYLERMTDAFANSAKLQLFFEKYTIAKNNLI
jgi:hypothetical protein